MAKPKEATPIQKIVEAAGLPDLPTSTELVAVPPAKEIVEVDRRTRAKRKADLVGVLSNLDEVNKEALQELAQQLASYPSLITADIGNDPVLVEEYAETVISQALATSRMLDLVEVVKENVKRVVFEHFNAKLKADGNPDPENVNAILEVEGVPWVLKREGAGYTDAKIDEKILKEVLGKDWKKVYTRTVIPRQVIETLDEELLWQLVKDRPELLEKVRDSLILGQPKKARLNLRHT